MIIESKQFEKPDSGLFLGTIIDVIDLGLVPSKNPKFPESKVRIRIVWVLDKMDSKGRPYRIVEQPTASLTDKPKKSRLYEICEGVFGSAPPVPFDSELLIGRSNGLFITREGEFANIKGFMPLQPGQVPPTAPADFVRDKVKKANEAAAAAAAPANPTQANVNQAPTAQQAPAQEVKF